MGQEQGGWLLVGGRRRLGKALAQILAGDGPLVLTSSSTWEDDAGWVAECSQRGLIRTLSWDANDPGMESQMMADLRALQADGIRVKNAVLVAGTFQEQPLGSWEGAALDAFWRVNLSFPLLAAQAIAPILEEGGCLQFLLDTAIHRPWLKRLPYSVAKTGLGALVPGLAQLLAPRVRVVGHALGTVLPDEASDPTFLADRSLLKRIGNPDDVIRSLRFAAASPFLTGEILTLDGGRRWI